MRALDRKLVRDLWGMRGQAIAITLVMASGVATFVMTQAVLESLSQTRAAYYDRHRFAHIFAHVKRAPLSLAERAAEIPGVAVVQARVVVDVTLDVRGLSEPATGRIVSLPDRGAPELNDVYLREGRLVEAGRAGEVLVSDAFAEAHHLRPGDGLSAVINGKKQKLTVTGIAMSPEYVFQIRPGDLFPDSRRFAILWMNYTELASAFSMKGAFNDLTVSLSPGASEPEVLRRLDELTEPYGGLGAFGRVDQTSHAFLDGRMQHLRGMGVIIPTVFLGVTGFLLNVVLGRLVATQREQIAALKAFGYTSWEVGWHYLKLVLVLAVVGVVLGTAVGAWLARGVTAIYAQFYRFPVFGFHMPASVVALAALVCVGTAVAGALGAVRRAVLLPPAEALRPEPPAKFRPTILERLGLGGLFSQPARMVLRNLERRAVRALMSSLAIALGVAILVVGSFAKDGLDYLMEFQFHLAQRQDMTLTFVEPTGGSVVSEVRQLPGVVYGEAFRSVPVRLRAGHLSRRVAVMGLPPDGHLYRLLDDHERRETLPEEGLVLSDKLAELLRVGVGDVLRVEVMEGERPVREAPVVGLVHEFTGTSAYMDLAALNRLMHEGPTVSGMFLAVDPDGSDGLYRRLKATPRVAGVTVKQAALTSLRETLAENLMKMRFFQVIFASVLACGVVYNTARVSLQERGRELATLRVIGFTRAEISFILLGELAVLTLLAVPVGLAVGYGLAALATRAMETDMYRIPLVVDRATFAFAVTVVLSATVTSALLVRRQLDQLDLVSVLKTKE